jgi:hypothetical protein
MLGALAGAESLEILVMLKDLSEQGFKKLEGNIKHAESTANRVNYSGFSKKTKGLAADAEAAAGKGGRGGLASLITGFTGLPGPIGLAMAAIGGFSASSKLSAATIPVYEKVTGQEKALDIAFKKHGSSLDALRPKIEAAIKGGEQYAFNAGDTREAILKLALAGHKWSDIQTALPHIMDLARAKHLDLAEAARMYELALMGNQRALKDLGIEMPAIVKKTESLKDAKNHAKIADQEYTLALHKLHKLQQGHAVTTKKVTESVNAHAVVTTHVTTVTKGHTASTDELTAAQIRVEKASEKSKHAHEALADGAGQGHHQGRPPEDAQRQTRGLGRRPARLGVGTPEGAGEAQRRLGAVRDQDRTGADDRDRRPRRQPRGARRPTLRDHRPTAATAGMADRAARVESRPARPDGTRRQPAAAL